MRSAMSALRRFATFPRRSQMRKYRSFPRLGQRGESNHTRLRRDGVFGLGQAERASLTGSLCYSDGRRASERRMVEARKLAAILAADVVGLGRLTGADEERTLARLRALRSDLIDPTIAVYKGRVVKRTGDGAIVEFRSVVDAVRCAIEVQNAMAERNSGVPEDRRIEFRIGVHLGDVVEENDGCCPPTFAIVREAIEMRSYS